MERALSTTTRRRGHQHHPRHTTRRRLDASSRGPAQCGPADTVRNTTFTGDETSPTSVTVDDRLDITADPSVPQVTLGTRWPTRINQLETKNSRSQVLKEKKEEKEEEDGDRRDENVRQRLAQCSPDVPAALDESKDAERGERRSPRFSPRGKNSPDDRDESDLRSKSNSPEPEHAVARARGDGNSDDESANVEEDPELAELAKLRCPSERTEVQAEREARRRKRCADYPGLAFGCSIFSSDTMMKFSLIKNELQNIMGNQLKRVSIAYHDGAEIAAAISKRDGLKVVETLITPVKRSSRSAATLSDLAKMLNSNLFENFHFLASILLIGKTILEYLIKLYYSHRLKNQR